MRPDIDNVDEYVRNTTARAFAVVASALGIPALLPFLKAVCKSKKSWQARHTGKDLLLFCITIYTGQKKPDSRLLTSFLSESFQVSKLCNRSLFSWDARFCLTSSHLWKSLNPVLPTSSRRCAPLPPSVSPLSQKHLVRTVSKRSTPSSSRSGKVCFMLPVMLSSRNRMHTFHPMFYFLIHLLVCRHSNSSRKGPCRIPQGHRFPHSTHGRRVRQLLHQRSDADSHPRVHLARRRNEEDCSKSKHFSKVPRPYCK